MFNMTTPEGRHAFLEFQGLRDVLRGCSCGCVHLLEYDGIKRLVIRFGCKHTTHQPDGWATTYTNPPNDGAVLDGGYYMAEPGEVTQPLTC